MNIFKTLTAAAALLAIAGTAHAESTAQDNPAFAQAIDAMLHCFGDQQQSIPGPDSPVRQFYSPGPGVAHFLPTPPPGYVQLMARCNSEVIQFNTLCRQTPRGRTSPDWCIDVAMIGAQNIFTGRLVR